jgi:hypothetical protein
MRNFQGWGAVAQFCAAGKPNRGVAAATTRLPPLIVRLPLRSPRKRRSLPLKFECESEASRHSLGRLQPCVRPLDAVHMTAGHNALRRSGPGQKPAFEMQWHEWVVLIAGSTGLLFAFPTFLSRQLWRVRPWSAAALTSGEPRSMACAMDLGVAITASASAVNRLRRSRSPCLLMLPSIASRMPGCLVLWNSLYRVENAVRS